MVLQTRLQLSGQYDGQGIGEGGNYYVTPDKTLKFTAYLHVYIPGEGYVPVSGKTVKLNRNGAEVGNGVTNQNGLVNFPSSGTYPAPPMGVAHAYQARFQGDAAYSTASSGVITVIGSVPLPRIG